MANAGPTRTGASSSSPSAAHRIELDGKHTIFGKCGNEDVVKAIAESERDDNDKPLKPVVIQSVKIIRGK